MATQFDADASRRYWRLAPSGMGKHDSTRMLMLPDHGILAEWDAALERRLDAYPDEEQFLLSCARAFAGSDVLSIGTGLGLHEMVFLDHGARVRCVDVVDPNLQVIRRVAGLKGLEGLDTAVGEIDEPDYGPLSTFDHVYFYGSLMTMPRELQRTALASAIRALRIDGRMLLMLYTWDFAASTCGWTDPADFDPMRFALASDPSVGAEDCPWSDWHDRGRLSALLPPTHEVIGEQVWNGGTYVWFEVGRVGSRPSLLPPFPARAQRPWNLRDALAVPLGGWEAGVATLEPTSIGLAVSAVQTGHGYLALSPLVASTTSPGRTNAVSVTIEVLRGGCSLGLLDVGQDRFVSTAIIPVPGEHQVLLRHGGAADLRVVLSNHDEASRAEVLLRRVDVGVADTVAVPPAQR